MQPPLVPLKYRRLPGLPWLIGIATFIIGAAISLLVVQTELELLLLAAIVGGILALILLYQPTWSIYLLVFMLYTRLSDVLVNFHGAPSIAKLYIPLLLLLVVGRWLLYNDQPKGLSSLGIIIAYGLIGLASLLYAADPTRVTDALSDFVKDIIIVAVIIALTPSGEALRRVIWTLLIAGIFLGTISVYQQLTSTFDNPYWGFAQSEIQNIVGQTDDYRIGGPGIGPNAFAQFLLILVPLALDRLWRERSKLGRIMAIWALSVCVLAIIFTFSRGAFVGLVLTIVIMLIYRPPKLKFIILTLFAGILLIGFVPDGYVARVTTLSNLLPGSTTEPIEDVSFRGRLSENRSAWLMFQDHPMLGVGLNNFKNHYQSYARHLGLDPRREERSPHSLYLEFASELGMVGLFWFVALQWVTFYGLYRARRDFIQAQRLEYADIALAYGVSLLSFLLTSIFLHLAYPRYFWLLYGIALTVPHAARYELARRQASQSSPPQQNLTQDSLLLV